MTSDADTARFEVWHGILFGQRSMMLDLAADLKRDFALTVAQFEALQVLAHSAPDAVTPTGLSRALLYSSGSTTNLVKQLEARGLAVRSPAGDDARGVQIRLTEAGKRLIDEASAAHRARIEEAFFPLLPDADLADVLPFVRRLAEHEALHELPHYRANGTTSAPAQPGGTAS